VVWAQVSATPILDDEGRFDGSFAMITDISERKRAEEAVASLHAELGRQIQRYQSLMEQASDAIFVADADRLYVDVNLAACTMLGYTHDELLGLTVGDVTPPELNPGQDGRWGRMTAGETVLSERILRRRDGTLLRAELSARRLADGRFQAIVRDITERKRLEGEQTRLAAAVEQAGEAIVITDPWATIQYVNPAMERVSGFTREELLGENPRLLGSGAHDEAFYRNLWATIRAGRTWRGTFVNRTKGGELYEEDAVISPIHDAEGRIVAYVGVKRDVTHQHALEAELRQTQKMQAVGRLAGGIAHDFNNLITAIRGYSDMAREALPPGTPERADLDQVVLAANRAADLTRQLLAFSRRQMLRPKILDPSGIVEGIAPMLRRLIGENITLETVTTPSAGCVRVDPSQLEQVIVNLVVNARDAMPDGGTILVETASGELGPGAERAGSEPAVGRAAGATAAVVLRVVDSGLGMDAATQARVFEPFFTTKAPGHGTGMGLSTVYGIVQQSGGIIRLRSEVDRGTTIEVAFPRVEPAADDVPDQPADGKVPGGSETILVVEDEPGVRDFVRRALEALGYRVITAGDGMEALAVAEAHEGPLELVVTDVVMPRLSGFELAVRVMDLRPETRVLIMSGFPDDEVGAAALRPGSWAMLNKPFSGPELAQAVRGALAGTDATRLPRGG
jgi:PAS domain S-box-containing protein